MVSSINFMKHALATPIKKPGAALAGHELAAQEKDVYISSPARFGTKEEEIQKIQKALTAREAAHKSGLDHKEPPPGMTLHLLPDPRAEATKAYNAAQSLIDPATQEALLKAVKTGNKEEILKAISMGTVHEGFPIGIDLITRQGTQSLGMTPICHLANNPNLTSEILTRVIDLIKPVIKQNEKDFAINPHFPRIVHPSVVSGYRVKKSESEAPEGGFKSVFDMWKLINVDRLTPIRDSLKILEEGGDLNKPLEGLHDSQVGMTPMHFLCGGYPFFNIQFIQKALKQGGTLDQPNKYNSTPLDFLKEHPDFPTISDTTDGLQLLSENTKHKMEGKKPAR